MIEKDGLVTDGEARTLRQLSLETDGIVVEIGSYTGKSTSALADGGSRVFAVDLWDLRLPGEKVGKARNKKKRDIKFNSTEALKTFLKRLKEPIDQGQVTWIRGESKEVAKAWSQPIGGLFIDGAHDAKSVKADYLGWAKWVKPGGWIAFHDAHGSNGVMDVLTTLVKPSGEWSDWFQVERLAIAFRDPQLKVTIGDPVEGLVEATSEVEITGDGSGETLPPIEDDEVSDGSSEAETVPDKETPPAARPRRSRAKKNEESDNA